MPAAKKPVVAPPVKSKNNPIYVYLILLSLAVNGYLLFFKQDKQNQTLVSVGGQSLRWKDLSPKGKETMARLDRGYYLALKQEADRWVENQILPKEAQAQFLSVPDLLEKQTRSNEPISPEEVYRVYVTSPQTDSLPWPQVLGEIENELKTRKAEQNKKKYLETLYAKYGVRYVLKAPGGDTDPQEIASRFTPYTPQLAGVPVRGADTAPILLEVYSDFMCPFSVRFNSSLQELDKQYPGKIKVAFRHFPLSFHDGAHVMAEASVCADEQGKFWEYHDRLMTEAKKRDKSELVQIASDLGLSTPKFADCLDSGRHVKKVDADIEVGKANGVQGTPGYLINGRRGSGAMPIEALKAMMDWHLAPSGVYPGKPQQPTQQQAGTLRQLPGAGVDPNKVYSLDPDWLKKGYTSGDDKAQVTLVEFFDYNCPFCKKGAEVSDALAAQYGSKLRRVAKHFPLAMHPNAGKTSEALLCAHEQSKFMEMRKSILGESWGKSSVDELKAVAKTLGLNENNFNVCLDSGKMKAQVDEDIKMAGEYGVQSTPTFLINGSPLVGAQPIEVFQKAIDEKLNNKK